MTRFTDEEGNIYTVDAGKNLFRNGKVFNPHKADKSTVKDATEAFINRVDIKPLSFAVGHVPNFEFGYGDNRQVVSTGHKAW